MYGNYRGLERKIIGGVDKVKDVEHRLAGMGDELSSNRWLGDCPVRILPGGVARIRAIPTILRWL